MKRFTAIAITLAKLPRWVIAERTGDYRSRLGNDGPDDGKAGNLPDWAIGETDLCEELMLRYKDEWKALLAKRLQKQ